MGVILDSAVVGVAKPDPGIFRIALDALNVPADGSVLHVGDSLRYDVAGALAAGLQPVHMDPYGLCPAPDGHRAHPQPDRARPGPDIDAAFTLRHAGELDYGRHALVHDAHPHAARRPGRRRRAQPPPAAPRGLYPPADGRALLAAAARPAGPAQGDRDHPRGDGPDRRAGTPDAGHAPGRAVGQERPLGADGRRAVPAQGPQGRGLRPRHDPRGDHLHPGHRAGVLPRAAADVVPVPDQAARRAAAQGRPDAHPRVHHEGLLQLRPGRGRAGRVVPGAPRRVRADLRAPVHPRRPGRRVQRRDGRLGLHRVHLPVPLRRGPHRPVPGVRLRREHREGHVPAGRRR